MNQRAVWHRTKIVCTVGPATDSPEVLERMILSGMDAARINTSHGDVEEHRRRIQEVREVSQRLNQPVAIFIDLPGPKLRMGQLPRETVEMTAGSKIALGHRPTDPAIIPTHLPQLVKEVRAGETIYLSDGAVKLVVEEVLPDRIICRVVVGGAVRSGGGINLPDTQLSIAFPTEEDIRLIAFAVEQDAEWIGVSFVRTAQDIQNVRSHLSSAKPTLLMAKIEKRQALNELESITETSNGIMVARGDLGVETELSDIPMVQKRIVAMANAFARPVITATQMLESMVNHANPTRAEVTDVANAVLDGTDGVMLSAESAIGQFPVEAVQTLHRVIRATETDYPYGRPMERFGNRMSASFQEAVSLVACQLSFDLDARAIIVPVHSVRTALQISRFRPKAPILALASSERLCRQLAVVWGVVPLLSPSVTDTKVCLIQARQWLTEQKLAAPADPVVLLSASSISRGFNDTLQVINLP
ncbi:MAG: pyruvate kinase [Candidatus Omnitrophica bacterium]|nr:pyruvate kinase [Candidatus Omnitrophota bacterium]